MFSQHQTGYTDSSDMLCKTLLQQLLHEQSVANVAASIEVENSLGSRRGTAIVGRKSSSVSDQENLVPSPTPDNPAAMALLQSYLKERATVSAQPMMPAHKTLDRSVSLPADSAFSSRTMNADRYKTELCRQFQETGFCKYGAKCQFAHGAHELRNVSRHHRYKTEMCRTYHLTGICPYGTRCHFVHAEEDVNKQEQRVQTSSRRTSLSSSSRRSSSSFNPAVGTFSDFHQGPGSVGETPPSSLSCSPAPSPTLFRNEDAMMSQSPVFVPPPPGFSALPSSAPPAISGVFNFHEYLSASAIPMMHDATSPLCVDIKPSSVYTPGYSLHKHMSPQHHHTMSPASSSCFSDFMMNPPTPPMSYDDDSDSLMCSSPMDVSRSLRLPVFSQLSKE